MAFQFYKFLLAFEKIRGPSKEALLLSASCSADAKVLTVRSPTIYICINVHYVHVWVGIYGQASIPLSPVLRVGAFSFLLSFYISYRDEVLPGVAFCCGGEGGRTGPE